MLSFLIQKSYDQSIYVIQYEVHLFSLKSRKIKNLFGSFSYFLKYLLLLNVQINYNGLNLIYFYFLKETKIDIEIQPNTIETQEEGSKNVPEQNQVRNQGKNR